jgi:hypothetical protein
MCEIACSQDRMVAAREDAAPQREDFSDLVAKKAREQKRKADSKAAEKNKRQKDKVGVSEHRRCGRPADHGRWPLAAGPAVAATQQDMHRGNSRRQ